MPRASPLEAEGAQKDPENSQAFPTKRPTKYGTPSSSSPTPPQHDLATTQGNLKLRKNTCDGHPGFVPTVAAQKIGARGKKRKGEEMVQEERREKITIGLDEAEARDEE